VVGASLVALRNAALKEFVSPNPAMGIRAKRRGDSKSRQTQEVTLPPNLALLACQ